MTVEVTKEGALGRLTLNNPKALHALDRAMCEIMTDALKRWATDDSIVAVLVDHKDGTRGFCAGGDIRMLYESGRKDGVEARAFFATEYRLNALIQSYKKPYVAILDGITMGGGVGISVHGPYRVATENTLFAMPETGIGLFPDVGGGWFLPRLPGEAGTYLALTGARIKAADVIALGIATHYVPAAALPELKAKLQQAARSPVPRAAIEATLAAASQDPGPAPLAPHLRQIDRLFVQDRVEDIVFALTTEGSEWAKTQAQTLATKSPQTLKVALRQLREGRKHKSFADNMKMEYRIGSHVVVRHDFIEGVRATLIDRDGAPKWKPATLPEMTEAELDAIFAAVPDELVI